MAKGGLTEVENLQVLRRDIHIENGYMWYNKYYKSGPWRSVISGSGKFERTGLGSYREAKESIETAFRYLCTYANLWRGDFVE